MASSGSFNTSGYDGRYLRFEWSVRSQSVSANQTTINWSLKGAGGDSGIYYMAGNFKVVIDGSTVYSSSDRIQLAVGTVVASGTFTMTHSSNGSRSFSASAEAGIYYYAVNCSGSNSWSLPTIARAASITSAPNFNDTQNPTINYSNPAGNSVSSLQACISLTGSTDDIVYRNIPKTGTSYTFNLTQAERNVLMSATANSKSRTVYFYVRTIIGGTTLHNNVAKTFTVTAGAPTFSVAYSDTNSSTVAVTESNQVIVQNLSTLQISVTNATAYKYATLVNATCKVLGTNYSQAISNGSATLNIGTVDTTQNLSLAVTVTDSRGYTTTQNLSVAVAAWSLPTAIITAQRENNYYSNTTVNVDADYASVNNKNTITIQVRYKKATDSTWSSYISFQDNVSQVISFDNDYAWDIQALLTDKFGSTTYNLSVARGMPITYFDRLRNSVGFNCFPSSNYSVESEGLQIDNNVYVGSQELYNAYTISSLTSVTILSAYDYDLVSGLFGFVTVPDGYEKAIRISAQISTTNSNTAQVQLNNLSTNATGTYSNQNYRRLITSQIMALDDITLEESEYNTSRDGLNLVLVNAGNTTGKAYFYNIMVHGYLVKKSV